LTQYLAVRILFAVVSGWQRSLSNEQHTVPWIFNPFFCIPCCIKQRFGRQRFPRV